MTLPRAALAIVFVAFATTLPAHAQGSGDILPDGPGKPLISGACASCHPVEMVVAKRRTTDEWDEVVGKMIDRGANLSEEEQDQVVAYLAKNFGAEPAAAAPPAPAAEPPKGS